MSHSCCSPDTRDAARRRTLWAVLGINAVMFVVELSAGLYAGSVALQADSLDMLGDTLVYGFSLAVVTGTGLARARAAQLKGAVMLLFAVLVLGQIVYKVMGGGLPDATVITVTGVAALLANALCVVLLFRHRSDDVNMRSTWICSRNDIVANVSVIAAAAGVAAFSSLWPDVVVSAGIVALFLWSAVHVLRDAGAEAATHRRTSHLCHNRLCPKNACHCPAT